jgi:hypothetical protein
MSQLGIVFTHGVILLDFLNEMTAQFCDNQTAHLWNFKINFRIDTKRLLISFFVYLGPAADMCLFGWSNLGTMHFVRPVCSNPSSKQP